MANSDLCFNSSAFAGELYDGKYYYFHESIESESNWTDLYNACNCSSFHKDTVDALGIAAIRIIVSLFSILGSASIILSVLLTGKLSAAEVHPLFILSVADFILSILWMIGGIVWINPGDGGWARKDSDPHTGMCYVLAIATTMTEIVAYLLTAVYAQSALLRIREVYLNQGIVLPSNDSRKKFRHILTVVVYVTSWVLPLLVVLPIVETVVGISSTNNGCWCVLDFFNLRPDDGVYSKNTKFNKFAMIHATILGVSFVLITLCIAVMYSLTFFYATKVVKLQSEQSESNKGGEMIKTIVKRLSLFLIIFFISGLPTLLASILVWSENERLSLSESGDRAILYLHAMFSPLQGFLNAIVYGWSRKEFRRAVSMKDRVQYSNRSRNYESLNHPRPSSSGSYNIGLARNPLS